MVKTKKFLIILTIITFIIFSSVAIVQFKKHLASDKVMQYLTEVKGYKESEILTFESKYTFFGIPKYHVEVIFKNEPSIVYLYFANDLNGQFEFYEIDGKTIPTKDLQNYDPA
ncbi:DUF3139 domain-containing protein [Lysinibacillus sp. NPDC097195]|uniref:DUF3139 domain-containing protein n=1 Tax=Lysinibacillus sp. NPDC097195 TaxID=3364141 RepID=UPI0037FE4488